MTAPRGLMPPQLGERVVVFTATLHHTLLQDAAAAASSHTLLQYTPCLGTLRYGLPLCYAALAFVGLFRVLVEFERLVCGFYINFVQGYRILKNKYTLIYCLIFCLSLPGVSLIWNTCL